MDIKISLIGSAHRIELWKHFYNSIATELNYEIIFVGDRKPNFVLPKEMKFIHSTVKPAQCFEIAYRKATGELLFVVSDDFTFSPYILDVIYNFYETFKNYKTIIAPRYIQDGKENTHHHTTPICSSFTRTVPLTPAPIVSKQIVDELGGLVDKNFICGQWENDLIMRIYAAGGNLQLCEGVKVYEEHTKHRLTEANFRLNADYESHLFISLWLNDESQIKLNVPLKLVRTKAFEPFVNKNLLFVSQGKKGK